MSSWWYHFDCINLQPSVTAVITFPPSCNLKSEKTRTEAKQGLLPQDIIGLVSTQPLSCGLLSSYHAAFFTLPSPSHYSLLQFYRELICQQLASAGYLCFPAAKDIMAWTGQWIKVLLPITTSSTVNGHYSVEYVFQLLANAIDDKTLPYLQGGQIDLIVGVDPCDLKLSLSHAIAMALISSSSSSSSSYFRCSVPYTDRTSMYVHSLALNSYNPSYTDVFIRGDPSRLDQTLPAVQLDLIWLPPSSLCRNTSSLSTNSSKQHWTLLLRVTPICVRGTPLRPTATGGMPEADDEDLGPRRVNILPDGDEGNIEWIGPWLQVSSHKERVKGEPKVGCEAELATAWGRAASSAVVLSRGEKQTRLESDCQEEEEEMEKLNAISWKWKAIHGIKLSGIPNPRLGTGCIWSSRTQDQSSEIGVQVVKVNFGECVKYYPVSMVMTSPLVVCSGDLAWKKVESGVNSLDNVTCKTSRCPIHTAKYIGKAETSYVKGNLQTVEVVKAKLVCQVIRDIADVKYCTSDKRQGCVFGNGIYLDEASVHQVLLTAASYTSAPCSTCQCRHDCQALQGCSVWEWWFSTLPRCLPSTHTCRLSTSDRLLPPPLTPSSTALPLLKSLGHNSETLPIRRADFIQASGLLKSPVKMSDHGYSVRLTIPRPPPKWSLSSGKQEATTHHLTSGSLLNYQYTPVVNQQQSANTWTATKMSGSSLTPLCTRSTKGPDYAVSENILIGNITKKGKSTHASDPSIPTGKSTKPSGQTFEALQSVSNTMKKSRPPQRSLQPSDEVRPSVFSSGESTYAGSLAPPPPPSPPSSLPMPPKSAFIRYCEAMRVATRRSLEEQELRKQGRKIAGNVKVKANERIQLVTARKVSETLIGAWSNMTEVERAKYT